MADNSDAGSKEQRRRNTPKNAKREEILVEFCSRQWVFREGANKGLGSRYTF